MNAPHRPAPATALDAVLNVIGGRSVPAASGAAFAVACPSDGLPFAEAPRSGAEDIDAAVRAARAAFEGPKGDGRGGWGRTPALERGRLLMKLGEAVLARQEELARLEARDTGKPIGQARADVAAAARYFEFYGSAADKLHGSTIPFLDGTTVLVIRDPHGVTGHIVPWNYPVQIFGRSVGASLAAGNACVVKPAEDAGLSLVRFAEIAREVGFPDGVLNVVCGFGEEAGAALTAHGDVNFLSFTGSPEVGTLVQQAAARNQVGVTLELGGKSPQIVFADADLEALAPIVVRAITQNGGQTCSAGSRLLVEASAFDRVVSRIADLFSKVRVGAHDMDLDLGAMINAKQRERVERFVRAAEAVAAPVARGQLADGLPEGGHYVAPAFFAPVAADAALSCEEVFGPVLAALPFRDEEEAVRLANGTPFGLVAGVWTADSKRSMRMARAMRCGQVFVNGYGAGFGVELPFGGVKRSGHGREKGFEALHEFTAMKTIVLNHG